MAAAPAGPDREAHILVVDDDTRLRELLQRYLVDNHYRVTTAGDAAEARRKLVGLAFDLIVLDVMMPGEDGLELTRALRATSDVPILLLTAMGEAEDRIAGLEHGADDYLTKPFEPRELILRIATILRRAKRDEIEAQGLRLGACAFDPGRGELRRGEEMVRLTTAEAEVMKIFARNPGVTLSRAELSRRSGALSLRAVDVQIARLRRKIEPEPKAPRYLRTVWGKGYVLWPD
ncbi:MAG: response regulator [Alphaproteobacteria bacterium]|nr:response regulator [Alphaproteobacteria bacterium]